MLIAAFAVLWPLATPIPASAKLWECVCGIAEGGDCEKKPYEPLRTGFRKEGEEMKPPVDPDTAECRAKCPAGSCKPAWVGASPDFPFFCTCAAGGPKCDQAYSEEVRATEVLPNLYDLDFKSPSTPPEEAVNACRNFCATDPKTSDCKKMISVAAETVDQRQLLEKQRLGGDCPVGVKPGTICSVNPLSTTQVPVLVGRIINTALGILGSLALLMFIYGGVTWLTAYGSTEKIQKGKDIMVWAILGLLLIFASFALVRFVLGAFTRL